jgi:hypothetical protein
MTAELSGYKMDGVMSDMGSNVKILPKKSWEVMGNPKLVWSHIQLQYKIYLIVYPKQIEVNTEGVKTKVDFEAF